MHNEIVNVFEETKITHESLPVAWQQENILNELECFLQSNWNERKSIFNDEVDSSMQRFVTFLSHNSIRTNNYVGTIIFNGAQLNIFPKVFKTHKNNTDTSKLNMEELISNLTQWLEYSTKYSYPYLKVSGDLVGVENLKELFITIFVKNLHNAFERSLYFSYEEKDEVIGFIKGKLNINDYYTKQYCNGNLDKFRCVYSNYEFDNLLNRIIKFTCKKIINETRVQNQFILRKIITKLSDVSDVICTPFDCDKVQINKLQSHYKIILSMCKMFLSNSYSNYTYDSSDTLCFLFPTEILFEGFIGGYIKEYLSSSANVILQASGMKLIDNVFYKNKSYGNAFTMRHDILCEFDKKIVILDTKYKLISRFDKKYDNDNEFKVNLLSDVLQADLYQMCQYALKRNCKDVYLIYPLLKNEDLETDIPVLRNTIPIDESFSKVKCVDIHVVRIPFVFENDTLNKLNKVLKDIFDC